ncbi:MAG: HEAT repeat domain-containing protein [Sulfobacillus sp.]
MSSLPISQIDDSQIRRLVSALDSLGDGELAVDLLVACGERAIAPLEELLLRGAARTIALPRCRAARALGALGAYRTLLAYFQQSNLPSDPVVLFAEDAVRSAVAHELLRWQSEEVFQTLLRAATQRVTIGMVEALGEFRSDEAIPLLFKTLEDDLCRNAAMDALRKTSKRTVDYAILSIREKTDVSLIGLAASRRRRATAELLDTLGISREEWQEVRDLLLEDEDAGTVVSGAAAGFRVAPAADFPHIVCVFR